MNIREIKLALTVDLMNFPESPATVADVQNAMSRFHHEAGSFKGFTESDATFLGEGFETKSYALHFEKVTLDLDLFTNVHSSEQLVKGFNLKENYA